MSPSPYIVDKCPIGELAWLWTTSFERAVVPEVK
jgi:hypothetical protein